MSISGVYTSPIRGGGKTVGFDERVEIKKPSLRRKTDEGLPRTRRVSLPCLKGGVCEADGGILSIGTVKTVPYIWFCGFKFVKCRAVACCSRKQEPGGQSLPCLKGGVCEADGGILL